MCFSRHVSEPKAGQNHDIHRSTRSGVYKWNIDRAYSVMSDVLPFSIHTSMTRHPFLRFVLHPVVIPSVAAFLLLAANLVPRAQVGIPGAAFFSPGYTGPRPSNGVLHYGWPKTARVDEFIQYTNISPSAHYSLNHLMGTQEFYVQTTRQSALNHTANSVFVIAMVVLSALGMRAIANGKLSVKSLFVILTFVGILFASFEWGNSLSTSEPLAESLRWYTAEN